MKQPLVSIIVPIYNAEKYLHDCLDTIMMQIFDNWEAILVDDGSKDNSGSICDEYVKKDSRFKVIHKENGGVSSARNRGINDASGIYICFVDSDDRLLPDYLTNFIDILKEDYDVLIQSFKIYYQSFNKYNKTILPEREFQNNYSLVRFLEDFKGVHNGFIWHRLFKSKIIKEHNLFFNEDVSFAEDGWFFLEYLKYAGKSKMTSNIGYIYTIRDGSLTSLITNVNTDVLIKVFEGFMNAMLSYSVSESDKDDYTSFVKKYGWRLAENWFIRRGFIGKDTIARNYSVVMLKRFNMNTFNNGSMSLKLIIFCLNIDCTLIRYTFVRIIESYRILKTALVNRL